MMFDSPQWGIRLRNKGKSKSGRQLFIYRENQDTCFKQASIYMPSDLYPLLAQVIKHKPSDVLLYIEIAGNRYTLGVETPDSLYDLWYYTTSNIPSWLRRIL